jgi:predicted RNA-binding protein YlqC (UPF0109 family)
LTQQQLAEYILSKRSFAPKILDSNFRYDLISEFVTVGNGGAAVRELIEIMAKALVEHPDQVRVSEVAGEHASVIELRTAKEDLGKVIGKRGRNAQAMRTILNAASAKLKKRVLLEIIEEEEL